MADSDKSERELLVDIAGKLDRLIGVTAIAGRDRDEHPDILINLGLDNQLVAAMTGLTANAVSIRKTRMKKPAGAKKKGK